MTVQTIYHLTCNNGHKNEVPFTATHCPTCNEKVQYGWNIETERKSDLTPDQLLSRLNDYLERKNLDIQWYSGVVEPGYDDIPTYLANWNPLRYSKIGDYIENRFSGIAQIEWSDEWSACDNCGKLVRTSPSSYGWEPYFIMTKYELTCLDCIESETQWQAEAFDEYKNNPDRAIPSRFIKFLPAHGFICYSPDEYCETFETGFNPGQNDDPHKIAKDIEANLTGYDYIFAIRETSQSYIPWNVFIRKQEEE